MSPDDDPGGAIAFDDAQTPREAAIDLFQAEAIGGGLHPPLMPAHDARRRRGVDQQPGDGDLEDIGDRRQGLQRWRGLVVLDLREIADVEVGQLADLCQRQSAVGAQPPDLGANQGPSDGSATPRCARSWFAFSNVH